MYRASPPEANRLVYRIRTALTGESVGLETAKLAWQQAEATSRANADLGRALEALENGEPLECLIIENAHPRLLETAHSLNHPQIDDWRRRCATYGWRDAEMIDVVKIVKIQEGIDKLGDLKDWLYSEYRAAVRAKEAIRAYQVIHVIAARFPEDATALAEAKRHTRQLVEQAADEVRDALEQLLPSETPGAVVQRYLAIGLPLEQSQNPLLIAALAEESQARQAAFTGNAQAVVDQAKTLREAENWQEVERSYIACDYLLAIHEARGKIDPALRRELEETATQIARRRSNFESGITIRLAIEELRSGATAGHKGSWLANRVEKLRSLEKQALKTSGQLSPELQAELKSAYSFARRRSFPRWTLLSGGSMAALLSIGWAVTEQIEMAEAQEASANALVLLQAVERSGQTRQASETLASLGQTIASAPTQSPLADQAAILEAWLETQKELAAKYADEVARLGALTNAPNALGNAPAISRLFAVAEKTRSDLAPDMGGELDAQLDSLRRNWDDLVVADQRNRQQEADKLEHELKLVVKSANQAKDRPEFQRLHTAALSRIQSLESLAAKEESSARASQLAALGSATTQQFAEMETKWGALESAWSQLGRSSTLESYLATLERIQSFDILPAEQKAAIAHSLRIKRSLQTLEGETLLPAERAGGGEFAKGKSYRGTQPALSEEEKAYLERLGSLAAFEQVYESAVQYFEGGSEAQSEYTIYLVEPISKSSSEQSATHVSFSFKVHGYDEFGERQPAPRDIQFISRADGSFWGFFYKPSTLSRESGYYGKTIKNTLKLVAGGADRFTLMKLIDQLEKQPELSPAFKAFWQQKLVAFMQLNPWKWGLALSPALQARASELETVSDGDISPTLWLSSIEQTVPSPEYARLASAPIGELALKEAAALADLYDWTLGGSFQLAGAVQSDGQIAMSQSAKADEPLWSVNALTGGIERLHSDLQLTPFAPILHYQSADGGDPQRMIERAEFASGLKLSNAPYAQLLPPILR